ncbi:MAG: hypothetical protein ACYC0N_02005 [Carboxydocellales bacterium]
MRTETRYYHELEDGREVEIPFNIECADIKEVQTAGRTILGCIVRDLDPSDPLEEFDEGTLVQFNRSYKHNGPRPDVEDFQDIIRENKGRVFYVHNMRDGYSISHLAIIKNSEDIEDADGYYIAPEDVKPGKQALRYADGAMEQYSAWCAGDVWGVCVWEYDKATLELGERDECWGYYGSDYAEQELEGMLKTYK